MSNVFNLNNPDNIIDDSYIEDILFDIFNSANADVIRAYFKTLYPRASLARAVIDAMINDINNYTATKVGKSNYAHSVTSLKTTIIQDHLKGGVKSLAPRSLNFLTESAYDSVHTMLNKEIWYFEKPRSSAVIGMLVNFYETLETRLFKTLIGDKNYTEVELLITRNGNTMTYTIKEIE